MSKSEELAVYSALIEQLYPESKVKVVVISDRTIDCPPYEREQDWQQSMLDSMPEVSTETFSDYLAKTKRCYSLNEISEFAGKYKIISDEEVMDIVRDRVGGWSGFYRRHPGVIGVIYLGRIGFNPGVNQALVYSALYYDVDGYRGTTALLSKKGDAWIVEQKYKS